MKTTLSILGMLLLFTFTQAQDDKSSVKPEDEVKKIEVAWSKTLNDFKEIPLGTPVTASYEFTNNGKEPVTVTKVKSSCGCTVASYSKEPVIPGKTGQVSATYNAAKIGAFNKAVTVYMSDKHLSAQPAREGNKTRVIKKPLENSRGFFIIFSFLNY